MSKRKVCIVKREIVLNIGTDEDGADIIKTFKSRQELPTMDAALAQCEAEQSELVMAMRDHSTTILNLGGIIFDARSVACARIDAREEIQYQYDDEDEDEDEGETEPANTEDMPSGIVGAKCVPDDEDDPDTPATPPQEYCTCGAIGADDPSDDDD